MTDTAPIKDPTVRSLNLCADAGMQISCAILSEGPE